MAGFEEIKPVLQPKDVLELREIVKHVYIDEKLKNYILDIVFATRYPGEFGLKEIQHLIEYGASPRASIYLTMASKAMAVVRGRTFVIPDDIKEIAPDVLRHRIIPTYEAEAENIKSDDIIKTILTKVEVP